MRAEDDEHQKKEEEESKQEVIETTQQQLKQLLIENKSRDNIKEEGRSRITLWNSCCKRNNYPKYDRI